MFYVMVVIYIIVGIGTIWLHSELYRQGQLYNDIDLINMNYEDYDIKVYEKKTNLLLEEENM